MERINDDRLDERIKAELTGLYREFFAKASRYVSSISKNRKEDSKNALHTTIEQRLEGMWLQHYGPEIRRLFFEEQSSLTEIRLHLAQSYGFRVSEERLRRFLRPSPVRKDFSDRTPDERATYVRSEIRHKSLQWLRFYQHMSVGILPEKDAEIAAPDPAEMWEARHTKRMVLQLAKEVMTDDQYDVFERRRRGEAHTVIAEELGISAEASRKRLHDGLEKLHEAVSKQGLI
jgi:hypothetical protein